MATNHEGLLDVADTIDLNEVASSVVEAMAPWALAQERMIAFSGSETPVIVKGNGHAVEDAIRNVVENAVVHSPARTEVVVTADPDGSVRVVDQGPGIPESDRKRIFERFWRGKGQGSSGAGLGLAIVAEIMRLHGGTVDVASRPEGGTSFTLRFKLTSVPR